MTRKSKVDAKEIMRKRILVASLLGVLIYYVGHGAIFGPKLNGASLRTALESVSALAKSQEVVLISPFSRYESLKYVFSAWSTQ